MSPNYTRVMRLLTSQPWALQRYTLETMLGIVEARVNGAPSFTTEEIRAHMGARAASGMTVQGGGAIAVIPLVGVIANKMNAMTNMSGGTSLDQFRNQFRRALADASVKAIVLAIDSPGGSVIGCQETWSEIMAARGTKPIVASVDALMASAALWLGSACDAIEITPSGEAGSLGVYLVHEDLSEANAKMGVKITYIASSVSPFKNEGNEDEPLSDPARAYLQSRVDDVAAIFVKQVAAGRGVPVATVQKTFGQGRVLFADEAAAVKMVDRIATFEQTIARLMGPTRKGMTASAIQELRAGPALLAGVVPKSISEKLAPRDTPWSAPTLTDFIGSEKTWGDLSDMEKNRIAEHFAWAKTMPPDTYGDLKLPHHRPNDGAVVFRGVVAALGRIDAMSDVPAADKPHIKAHLDAHEKQFEAKEPAKPSSLAGDHTDVGRDQGGQFHPQCACSSMCRCMADMADGTEICPPNCPTCLPGCPCLDQDQDEDEAPAPVTTDPMPDSQDTYAARALADEQAVLAALSGSKS